MKRFVLKAFQSRFFCGKPDQKTGMYLNITPEQVARSVRCTINRVKDGAQARSSCNGLLHGVQTCVRLTLNKLRVLTQNVFFIKKNDSHIRYQDPPAVFYLFREYNPISLGILLQKFTKEN